MRVVLVCGACGKKVNKCDVCGEKFHVGDELFCDGNGHYCSEYCAIQALGVRETFVLTKKKLFKKN